MNWLDGCLLFVLLIGAVRGFIHGFVYEVAHLGAFFLGLYAGFALVDRVTPSVGNALQTDPLIVHYVSFFIVFLAVWIGVVLLGKLFEGLLNVAFLGAFNKLAGAIFGFTKYLVITGVFLYFFHKLDSNYKWIRPDTKAESKLYYPILKSATTLLPILSRAEERAVQELKKPGT